MDWIDMILDGCMDGLEIAFIFISGAFLNSDDYTDQHNKQTNDFSYKASKQCLENN